MVEDILYKLLNKLVTIPVIGNCFKTFLYKKMLRIYDAAITFIISHEKAESIMDQMEIDIDEEVFKDVMQEAHDQIKKCKKFLYLNITDSFPDIAVQLQTKKACKCILIIQQKLTKKVYEQGVIKELEYKYLITAINKGLEKMKKYIKFSMPTLCEILLNRFSNSTNEEIEELLPYIKEYKFNAGDYLYVEGSDSNGGYLILRGRVHEQSSWIKQDLMTGNIVGAQHLLPGYDKNTSTAKAVTQVIAAHLPANIFSNDHLLTDLFKEASEEILLLNKEKFDLVDVKNKHILKVASHSNILSLKAGDKIDLTSGFFLLYGQIDKYQKAYCFVRPKIKIVTIEYSTICLMIPEQISILIQQLNSISQAFANFYIKSSAKSIGLSKNVKNADLIGLNAIHKLQKIRKMSRVKVS